MKNQQENNYTSDRKVEMQYALSIQKNIQNISDSSEINNAVFSSLQGILSAETTEELEVYSNRLNTLLHNLNECADTALVAYIAKSMRDLDSLVQKRQAFLSRVYSYLRFITTEKWPGTNFLLLAIPFIVGLFVPIVGIAALICASILTAVDIYDFGRESKTYWEWEDEKPSNETPLLDSERSELEQTFGSKILRQFNAGKSKVAANKVSRSLYATYIIALVISLIGLAALVFPPIGIPALALTVLTGVAIFLAVTQGIAAYNRRQHKLAQIQELRQITEAQTLEDTNLIYSNHHVFKASPTPPQDLGTDEIDHHTPASSNWLTNPLRYWFNKAPLAKTSTNEDDEGEGDRDLEKPTP